MSREFFEKSSENWEVKEKTVRTGEFIVKTLIPGNSRLIMDLGCGTGVLYRGFKEHIPHASVFSVDIAHGMLKKLREKHGQTKLIRARGACLPFCSNSFDAIIIFNAFPHFKEKERTVSDCHDRLKSGGFLIIAHSAPPGEINKLHREIGGDVKNHQLPPEPEFIQMFREAGFVSVRYVVQDYFYVMGRK